MRTLAVFAVSAMVGVGVTARAWRPDAVQEPKTATVDIAAERFSFTPSEVKTTLGTTLQIRLQSDDTGHGFRILDTNVNVEIPKRGRGTATVTFTPERAGRYTFECSKLCGAGHSFMRGTIVVAEATR